MANNEKYKPTQPQGAAKKIKSAFKAWENTTDLATGAVQVSEQCEALLIDAVNACLRCGVYLGISATRDGRSIKITAMYGDERTSVYASNELELAQRLEELAVIANSLS